MSHAISLHHDAPSQNGEKIRLYRECGTSDIFDLVMLKKLILKMCVTERKRGKKRKKGKGRKGGGGEGIGRGRSGGRGKKETVPTCI